MGGSAQWTLQAPLGRDRELIFLDLPGFGQNAGQTPLDRIEDFATWALDDLSRRGCERFDLPRPYHGRNDRAGDDPADPGAR